MLHYRLCTSYAWFHSVSLPLSDLWRWWWHWCKQAWGTFKSLKLLFTEWDQLKRLNHQDLNFIYTSLMYQIKVSKNTKHPTLNSLLQRQKTTIAPHTTAHKAVQGKTAYCSTPFLDIPLISLVNLTLWESARGRGCSSMLWMSRTSHMNWITGWAL